MDLYPSDGLETENSCAFYLDNLLQIGFAARSVGLQSLERVYWEIFQITTSSSSKQNTLTSTRIRIQCTQYTVQWRTSMTAMVSAHKSHHTQNAWVSGRT